MASNSISNCRALETSSSRLSSRSRSASLLLALAWLRYIDSSPDSRMTRDTRSASVVETCAPMNVPPPVHSSIMATNFSTAAAPRPTTSRMFGASRIAVSTGMPLIAAKSSSLPKVVAPMPRVGVLTMRASETSSLGLAISRRYAIAFFTSSRS